MTELREAAAYEIRRAINGRPVELLRNCVNREYFTSSKSVWTARAPGADR
jgi:C-terminal binding protein